MELPPPPTHDDPMFAECLRRAHEANECGKIAYRRGSNIFAVQMYMQGMSFLDQLGMTNDVTVKRLRINLINNMAQAQLRARNYEGCIESLDVVLNRMDGNNVKALYRRGSALLKKGRLEESITSLMKARTLEPGNELVQEELTRAKDEMEKARLTAGDGENPMIADCLVRANHHREIGNNALKNGSKIFAVKAYMEALAVLNELPNADYASVMPLRIKLINNMAAAQLKAKNYEGCIESCDIVLSIESNNVKALFRRGSSLVDIGFMDEAIRCLNKLLEIEPTNKAAKSEIVRAKKAQKVLDQEQKQLYQRMIEPKKVEEKEEEKEEIAVEQKKDNRWGSWAKWAAGAAIAVTASYVGYRFLKA